MASLFRPTYTRKIPSDAQPCTKDGQPAVWWKGRRGNKVVAFVCADNPERCLVEVAIWWMRWVEEGEEKTAPASADKAAAQRELAAVVERAAQIAAGMLPPGVAQAKDLLLDKADEYRDELKALRRKPKHIRQTHQQIVDVCEGCRFSRFGDLEPRAVVRFLAELRERKQDQGKARDGLGVGTTNQYLQAIKAFSAWLARQVRSYDPLADLRPLNADVDRRVRRRAVTRAEFERLCLAALRSQWVYRGLTGADRWALYLVASFTGLRAAELASLTPESIDLGTQTVEVEAAFAKGKRRDLLPLAEELMRQIRGWLADRPAGKQLWPSTWFERAAEMLQRDLQVAEIDYRDGRGRVFDFHALRGQFITDLARAGVSITLAQRLARHSTPALTARFYTHLELHDLAGAVDRLGGDQVPSARKDVS